VTGAAVNVFVLMPLADPQRRRNRLPVFPRLVLVAPDL